MILYRVDSQLILNSMCCTWAVSSEFKADVITLKDSSIDKAKPKKDAILFMNSFINDII